MNIRSISVLISILLITFISGCGGRAANPIMVHQYGDEAKSCKALKRELEFIESEVNRLVPETKKAGTNTALGVAGVFLIVPWFFMDFSKAEQIELNALRQRYNHLVILSDEKDCELEKEKVPDFKEKSKTDEDVPKTESPSKEGEKS